MKKFFKKIDQWLQFSSPLSKTGLVFIGLACVLTLISFVKGIQVLMFVPAFMVALFAFSAWDYYLAHTKIFVQRSKESRNYILHLPNNTDGYFFKLAIKESNTWRFLPLPQNNISWQLPNNTTQIKILASGRLDIFQKFFVIEKNFSENREEKPTQDEDIMIEISEYSSENTLENIDPKKSALTEKIFIREKIFEEINTQKISQQHNLLSISSSSFLQKFSSIQKAFIAEWILIGIGFIGVFLQWGGIIFPIFFVASVGFIFFLRREKKTNSKNLPGLQDLAGLQKTLPQKFLNPLALILFFATITEGFVTLNTVLSGAHFLLSLAVWKHAFNRQRRDGFTYIFLILFVFIALSLYTLAAWFLFLFLAFLVLAAFLFTNFSGGELPEEYSARFGTPYTTKFFLTYFSFLLASTFFFFLVLPHGDTAKDTADLIRNAPQAQVGFTDQVGLNDVGSIKQNFSKTIVIENADPHKQNFYKNLYWRGARFESFDGTNWKKISTQKKIFSPVFIKNARKEKIQLKIYSNGQKNVFLPATPLFVQPQNIYSTTADNTIFELQQESPSAFFIDVTFAVDDQGRWQSIGEKPARSSRPGRFQNPEVEKIFEKFWDQIPENIQKNPQKISEYVQQKFSYSLDNPAKNIEDFLYTSQQGHCEYFATVLAVTLQHFGFTSATLVNGFHGGEWNDQAQAWVVRSQNAHSWVEIFDDSTKQWIHLDPTPSSSVQDDSLWYQENFATKFVIQLYDAIEIKWNRFFVEFTGSKQKEFFGWIFSFWKLYTAAIILFLSGKFLWWYRKNIFLPHKNRTAQENFLLWLQKLLGEKSGIFLEKYKKKFPDVVQKTQQYIFGGKKFSTIDEENLKKKWKDLKTEIRK